MKEATNLTEQQKLVSLEDELRNAVRRFKKGFTCEEQGRIALAYHEGRPANVLGIMPTGMGKSLCYLLPTYLWARDGGQALTVVVSPLLALMQDQVDAVERHNEDIGAFNLCPAQLNSAISDTERRDVRHAVRNRNINLLLLSPETLVQPWTYEMLTDAARNRTLRGLVIDEAHMIAEWGDQFRPAFKRMGPVRRLLQEAAPRDAPLRTLVLTATLPEKERKEVFRALGIEDEFATIEHRRIRAEHYLAVKRFRNHAQKLGDVVKDVKRLRESGPGIIYCARRKHCEEVAELLEGKGLAPAHYFHGGTAPIRRKELLREFRKSPKMIMVATDAFGLGVDKQDVRWVLHFSMPDSIDQYYQEIGRGGRDGRECEALLYYSPADRGIAKRNVLSLLTTEVVDARLRAMRREALTLENRRGSILRFVEEETLPDYIEDPDEARDSQASMRAHRVWNYAALVRAEQLGWIKLGPDVLHEVNCTLTPRATLQQVTAIAPTLVKAGLLSGCRPGRVTLLRLGKCAAEKHLDVRRLQQEFFDLMLAGTVCLPDDGRVWNSRILVEDLAIRHTARLGEDQKHRKDRQKAEALQVDRMAEYARSSRCRRWHFYRAYGYEDLYPRGGCGNCDVCEG
jgi:RecQ family ATP-dependent DNA helicase